MTNQEKVNEFWKRHSNQETDKIKVDLSSLPDCCFSTLYYIKNKKTNKNDQFYHNFNIKTGKVWVTNDRPTFYNKNRPNNDVEEGMICGSVSSYLKVGYMKSDVELGVTSFTVVWIKSKVNRPKSYDDLDIRIGETYIIVRDSSEIYHKTETVDPIKSNQYYSFQEWHTYERNADGVWKSASHFNERDLFSFDKYLSEFTKNKVFNLNEFRKVFDETNWVSATGAVFAPSPYNLYKWYKGYIKNLKRASDTHRTPKEKQLDRLLNEAQLQPLKNTKKILEKSINALQLDSRANYGWVKCETKEKDTIINFRGMIAELNNDFVVLRIISIPVKINVRPKSYINNNYIRVNDIIDRKVAGEPEEIARIYLSEVKNSFIFGMVHEKNTNHWVPMNKNVLADYNTTPICNPEALKDSIKVKYTLELCMDYTEFLRKNIYVKEGIGNQKIMSLEALFEVIQYPESEQMYKAGFKYIAFNMLSGKEHFLTKVLGYNKDIKCNQIFKKIDMNKYQLSMIEKIAKDNYKFSKENSDSYYYSPSMQLYEYHKIYKLFAKTNRFKDVDDETSKYAIISSHRFFRTFRFMADAEYTDIDLTYDAREQMIKENVEVISWVRIIAKLAYKEDKETIPVSSGYNRYFKTANDIVSCYRSYRYTINGGYRRRVDRTLTNGIQQPVNNGYVLDFSNVTSFNDLTRLHDAVTQLYNTTQNKSDYETLQLEEQNQKFLKRRKQLFEYSDDEYMIRVPEKLDEITLEGVKLGHCCGGYVDRVATGNTNILFLRKKTEPMIPFYTIEVKEKNLIQVHGHRNKHLGLNPEAVPFILRWLRDKNIHYTDSQVLDTGAGYSPNHILIPKPVI